MDTLFRRSRVGVLFASLIMCVGSACGQAPDAPADPAAKSDAATQAVPSVAPVPPATTAPADATAPAATTAPADATAPAATTAPAAEPVPPATTVPAATTVPPAVAGQTESKWALVICGIPGDEEHHTLFSETIESLHDSLVARLGFNAAHIRIQFGAEPTAEDGPAVAAARGTATRSELAAEFEDLRQQLQPSDTLWVFVLGHAHFDGRKTFLNLPGAAEGENDIHEDDFAEMCQNLPAARQVFFLTTPVSGFFIRPLSAKGRIIVTATEADREVNETLYPLALIETLAEPPDKKAFDVDGDGKTSLFDLYINVAQNVARRYAAGMLLSTEHGNLDDNGDGRGTELQLDYLTEEEGGRKKEGMEIPKIRPNSEGYIAQQYELPLVLPEPTPDSEAEPKPETTPEPEA